MIEKTEVLMGTKATIPEHANLPLCLKDKYSNLWSWCYSLPGLYWGVCIRSQNPERRQKLYFSLINNPENCKNFSQHKTCTAKATYGEVSVTHIRNSSVEGSLWRAWVEGGLAMSCRELAKRCLVVPFAIWTTNQSDQTTKLSEGAMSFQQAMRSCRQSERCEVEAIKLVTNWIKEKKTLEQNWLQFKVFRQKILWKEK